MELTITAKLRILPMPEENTLLLKTMRAYTDACNYTAAYIFHTCDLNPVSLNKALTVSFEQGSVFAPRWHSLS